MNMIETGDISMHYISAVNWLKNRYTPSELMDGDIYYMLMPYVRETGVKFSFDDYSLVFLFAMGRLDMKKYI